ncbi:10533_t:CDS:2, partial [Racocetra persica]
LNDDFQDLRNEIWHRNVQGTQGIQGEDLSPKEVYISIVKRLFSCVIYPTQDEIKESLKDYLNEKFPEFIANLSANDFANWFHGSHEAKQSTQMQSMQANSNTEPDLNTTPLSR